MADDPTDMLPLEPPEPDEPSGEIVEALREVGVTGEDASKLARQVRLAVMSEEMTTGHFPPPGMLERYDKVVPGLADRIIVIAERAAESDLLERSSIADDRRTLVGQRGRGQWLAFGLTAALIVAASVFFALGNNTAGIAFLGSDVFLVGVALLGGTVDLPRRVSSGDDEDEED